MVSEKRSFSLVYFSPNKTINKNERHKKGWGHHTQMGGTGCVWGHACVQATGSSFSSSSSSTMKSQSKKKKKNVNNRNFLGQNF